MADLKITIDQLKNYLGTGLKYRLNSDCHEEFYDMEDCEGFQEAFSKGSIWEFKGYTDIAIPAGEGDLEGVIIQHEKGFYISEYHFADPMCYRLSDLDKFVPELGFVPLDKLNKFKELSTGKMTSQGWENDTVGICDRDILKGVSVIGGGHWEGGCEEIELFQFFNLYQQLFQWHFWPFGDEYFEAGLVIDKLKMNDH